MKNNKNKLSSTGMNMSNDDMIVGTALSLGLVQPGKAGINQCPETEDIAAVVEGIAPAINRNEILAHVSTCPDCYESFLLAVELLNNAENIESLNILESKEETRKIIYLRPLPLTLAASIVIMIFSAYLFFRSSEIPKTPGALLEKSLLEKSETMKDYQSPTLPQSTGVSFQDKSKKAKSKTNKEEEGLLRTSPPPPPSPAKMQPLESKTDESKTFGTTAAISPEPNERRREEETKLERMKTDDEINVTQSNEDSMQDKKVIPIEQQAMLLNQQVQSINNYVPQTELAKLFNNTILLTQQMAKEFEMLRNEALMNHDFNKVDVYVNGLKPLMTVKVMGDKACILPDVEWFYSRSEPGSVENRFFSLARSGWCAAADLCITEKIDRLESQKLLTQWQNLEPQLTGIFKQVAIYTISSLARGAGSHL